MMLKKTMCICLAIIFLMFMPIIVVQADDDLSSAVEQIESQLEEGVSNDVRSMLDDYDIDVKDSDTVSKFSFSDTLEYIANTVQSVVTSPLGLLGRLMAVSVICCLAKSLTAGNATLDRTYEITGVLASTVMTVSYISDGIEVVITSLSDISTFMLAYVPVYSCVITTSGGISSGTAYYTVIFVLCQLITLVVNKIMLPFLSIIMAVSIIESLNSFSLSTSFSASVKKISQWILAGVTTLFVAILSIQGIVGASADTVAVRTAKFAASSFIPIIGNAVSEAYSTVTGSLGLIRSTVGGFGIIVILFTVLKPLLTVICLRAVIALASFINDVFGSKQSAKLLKCASDVLGIAVSVVVCISIVFVVATALIMLTCMNM